MMLGTFDRYLLARFFHTFVVFLISTYGLFIVIDLFTNMDEFQKVGRIIADGQVVEDLEGIPKLIAVTGSIVTYYGIRVSEFFELTGPILIVVAAITVLGLLEKNSESHPILAAGIPAFRLLKPLLLGAALLNGLLIINQEFICLLYTSPSPRDQRGPRMPSSA